MVKRTFTANSHAVVARLTSIADPERQLALSYAPMDARPALGALFTLDETLGAILSGGREPTLRQIRLAWWHEALTRLDQTAPPPQPLLQALAAHVLPRGVTGAALASMIDGWDLVIDPDPIPAAALARYAEARGGRLFTAAGRMLASANDPIDAAGQGWALVDLACRTSDAALAAEARAIAAPLLEMATAPRWSKAGRPIGMLAVLARIDCRAAPGTQRRQGSPQRVGRMMWHGLTGR